MSAATRRPARKAGKAAAASVESAVARLLALPPTVGARPALWRRADLARALLSRAEKAHLAGALARLRADGRLVELGHGKSVFFAFAEALRAPGGMLEKTAAAPPVDLLAAYHRLVRESGGFPDVKISALARAVGGPAARELPQRLIGAWRAGDAMLSLGDWSLANEEMRAAAVELEGEKYLLVRFEE